jgi:replication factor C subunit 1
MNVFGAAIILLNREKREPLKLREKLDLYFMDFDLIPLIV